MPSSLYSKEKMIREDLMILREFALNFLFDYPYTNKFNDLLLAITLCQGAANHYAVCQGLAKHYFDQSKMGVKDFDIWFFFKDEKGRYFNPRWQQHRDLGNTKFGSVKSIV